MVRTFTMTYTRYTLASKGASTPQVHHEWVPVATDLPQMVGHQPFRPLQPPTVPTRHNIIAVLSAFTEVFGRGFHLGLGARARACVCLHVLIQRTHIKRGKLYMYTRQTSLCYNRFKFFETIANWISICGKQEQLATSPVWKILSSPHIYLRKLYRLILKHLQPIIYS